MNYQTDTILYYAFDKFSSIVRKNKKDITPASFAKQFIELRQKFCSKINCDEFCSEADKLAANYYKSDDLDYAGIIYSTLCKIMERFPNKLEYFAKMGYEIAAANGDYVHMMARLNDLRKVYYKKPHRLYDYVQVLYKQEKCLKKLAKNYDSTVATYKSVQRKPASNAEYRTMLAHVQTEIGKLTKKKHPHDARNKLVSAENIFLADGNYRAYEYVKMLIAEIDNSLLNRAGVHISNQQIK